MDKIKIDLTNCFGIGKLSHEFDFTKSNTFLIYAVYFGESGSPSLLVNYADFASTIFLSS